MVKRQLNCEKSQYIKGKITKSSITFSENKPNSPIVQLNVTYLSTMNYPIFTSLKKVKNKPNQTQFKANSNPIPKRPKMNINIYDTKVYDNKTAFRREINKPNSKPIQTQCRQVRLPFIQNDTYEKIPKFELVFHLTYESRLLNCIKSRQLLSSVQNCPYQYKKPAFIAVRIPCMRDSYKEERRYYHVY